MCLRVYKDNLSFFQKVSYDTILKGLKCMKESIKVVNTDIDSLNCIFDAIRQDNPELYYVGNFRVQMSGGYRFNEILPEYLFLSEAVVVLNKNISTVVNELAKKVDKLDDWDKVLYVHDWLCQTVKYAECGQESHSIVGVLISQIAVCEGISKAFKFICDRIDVECCYVSGKAKSPANPSMMENHAWNKVKINGEWYNIDVTFDNTIGTNNRIRHDYFLISDKDMQKDHIELSKSNLPCVSENLSYYVKKNLIIHNQQQLIDLTKSNIAKGIYSFEFKLPNASDINTIHQKVLKNIQKALQVSNKCKNINIAYNKVQLVFSVDIR